MSTPDAPTARDLRSLARYLAGLADELDAGNAEAEVTSAEGIAVCTVRERAIDVLAAVELATTTATMKKPGTSGTDPLVMKVRAAVLGPLMWAKAAKRREGEHPEDAADLAATAHGLITSGLARLDLSPPRALRRNIRWMLAGKEEWPAQRVADEATFDLLQHLGVTENAIHEGARERLGLVKPHPKKSPKSRR